MSDHRARCFPNPTVPVAGRRSPVPRDNRPRTRNSAARSGVGPDMRPRSVAGLTVALVGLPCAGALALLLAPPSDALVARAKCAEPLASEPIAYFITSPASLAPRFAVIGSSSPGDRPPPSCDASELNDRVLRCRFGGYEMCSHGDSYQSEPPLGYPAYGSDDPPQLTGLTGIGVSSADRSWWRDEETDDHGMAPLPRAMAIRDDALCVTFGDATYALDPHTLEPLDELATPARALLRLLSPAGAVMALLVLVCALGIARMRRALATERAFGRAGASAAPARLLGDGAAVVDLASGEVLRAKRARWHSAGRPERVLVARRGERPRGAGSPYRDRDCTVARLDIFPGSREQLLAFNAEQRAGAETNARAPLLAAVALLGALLLAM